MRANARANVNIGPDFITAGEATFTVSNGERHYTYHVYKAEPTSKFPNPAYFIKCLCGLDNINDYRYMGRVDLRGVDPGIALTSKSGFPETDERLKVARWALKVIWQTARGIYRLPPGYSIQHVGRCGKCGRPLTHPASLDTGLGPDCAAELGIEWTERNDRQPELEGVNAT